MPDRLDLSKFKAVLNERMRKFRACVTAGGDVQNALRAIDHNGQPDDETDTDTDVHRGVRLLGAESGSEHRHSATTELVAICDSDGESRRRARKQHPAVPVVASWEDVLSDNEIAAVVIALPIAKHFEFALQALKAGKHVMVEKPLAETVAQCDVLEAAARHSGCVLMVGHTFEYNGAVLAVRDYLRQGLLGELYYIAMRRLNLGIVRSDGNAMWSLAPHDISILCTWLEREPVSR